MRLTTQFGEVEAKRDNSALFRYIGKLAIYDHVFVTLDDENGMGFYVFSLNPHFERMSMYMLQNGYESHINMREVAECDKRSYDEAIGAYINDTLDGGIPEDWFKSDS